MATGSPELSVVIPTHNNLSVLEECLESWRRYAKGQPVELIVVEDGCGDGTAAWLEEFSERARGDITIRVLHESDAHELVCTNRGFEAARAPLLMTWHDDMVLRSSWLIPELLASFRAYPEIGLLSLSRGLTFAPVDEPIRSWYDTIDWRRIQSTIGPAPSNWLRLYEVDAVVRPWVVRRSCVEAVGMLDEAFRPTEWDEADLCYRLRDAGWRVATHGYERESAYEHRVSTTYGRSPEERRLAIGLRNSTLFFERWGSRIAEEHGRVRRSWLRRASARGWLSTAWAAVRILLGRAWKR